VLDVAGLLHLRRGRLHDAEERLRRAVASPMTGDFLRAHALYNLACVLARTEREEECREVLAEAVRLNPQNRQLLCNDPDFAAVRGSEWFTTLMLDSAV
jgi:Flp pilus assembly protein TadD